MARPRTLPFDGAEPLVSLRAEVPEPLLEAMRQFIERHPNWDQYRLFQAALAGFLVQNGIRDRGDPLLPGQPVSGPSGVLGAGGLRWPGAPQASGSTPSRLKIRAALASATGRIERRLPRRTTARSSTENCSRRASRVSIAGKVLR